MSQSLLWIHRFGGGGRAWRSSRSLDVVKDHGDSIYDAFKTGKRIFSPIPKLPTLFSEEPFFFPYDA